MIIVAVRNKYIKLVNMKRGDGNDEEIKEIGCICNCISYANEFNADGSNYLCSKKEGYIE